MTDLQRLIAGASNDSAVRFDLQRLNETGGHLTQDILDRAKFIPGHAARLSAALQRIEVAVGNDSNFGLQRQVDTIQQRYDRAANVNGVKGFRSGDSDGVQNYQGNPQLAAAERAAEHAPIGKLNAAHASAEMQRQQELAAVRGNPVAAAQIDRLQKLYERDEGIANGMSEDRERFAPQAQLLEAAMALSFILQQGR